MTNLTIIFVQFDNRFFPIAIKGQVFYNVNYTSIIKQKQICFHDLLIHKRCLTAKTLSIYKTVLLVLIKCEKLFTIVLFLHLKILE